VAIVGVHWSRNSDDLHVLRGQQSRPLAGLLWLLDSSTGNWILATDPSAPPTMISFEPIFPFTKAAHGIEVSSINGVVTTDASLATNAHHVPNFLIYATVRDLSTFPPTTLPRAARIRVHVHALDAAGHGISHVWLAPSPMTIRQNAPGIGARFSVFADFTDGTVGNLSMHPGMDWELDPASPAPPHLTIDRATGELKASGPGPDHGVRVTLPPDLESRIATQFVHVEAPWSTPLVAHLLPDSAGANRIADVPNILFLPDGFMQGEETLFKDLLTKLIASIRTHETTFPLGLLAGSMNFWYAFLHSRERGATVANLIRPEKPSWMKAVDLPRPLDPATNRITDLPQLIHQVGLPMPTDLSINFSHKAVEWNQTYDPAHVAGMTEPLFAEWQKLAGYTLAFDRDTAFGVTTGIPPQVLEEDDGRAPYWHRRRIDREQIDDLLNHLRDDSGQTIGGTWGSATGADRPYIFILSAGARSAGANHPGKGVLAALVDNPLVEVRPMPGSNMVFTEPHAVPTGRTSWLLRALVAHESAHAMHVGDEYGGHQSLGIALNKLGLYYNLQDASTAEDASGLLQPDRMRWNWPRMIKVGVLLAPPVPMPFNQFLIEARGSVFADDEQVRLRARPLSGFNAIGPKLEIVHRERIGATIDRLLVSPLEPWTPTDWTAGNLIYTPKTEQGVELRLCSPLITQYIAHEHNPMNRLAAASCVVDKRDKQTLKKTTTPLPLPDLTGKGITFESWLIGYWDGGNSVYCGIFHPAGACLMRGLLTPTTKRLVYRFCAVCRYIVTDVLDPTKHPLVDAEYKPNFYPL
jgi:hypothetical protein